MYFDFDDNISFTNMTTTCNNDTKAIHIIAVIEGLSLI